IAHRIGLRRGSAETSRGSSTSREIRIEHSHHRIADFLRELTSPHLVAWQRLNQITRITDLGAEGTQPIRIGKGLRNRGINWLQQNEQVLYDVGLRELDLVPGEESLQVVLSRLLSGEPADVPQLAWRAETVGSLEIQVRFLDPLGRQQPNLLLRRPHR